MPALGDVGSIHHGVAGAAQTIPAFSWRRKGWRIAGASVTALRAALTCTGSSRCGESRYPRRYPVCPVRSSIGDRRWISSARRGCSARTRPDYTARQPESVQATLAGRAGPTSQPVTSVMGFGIRGQDQVPHEPHNSILESPATASEWPRSQAGRSLQCAQAWC